MPRLVEEEAELDNPQKVALQGIHRCHLSSDTKDVISERTLVM